MNLEELRQAQRAGAVSNISSLIVACRQKFVDAANLLELKSPLVERLQTFGNDGRANVWSLLNAFTILADRYNEHFFSPQLNLFQTPRDRQDEKWSAYFHLKLVPALLTENHVVRNVLRAVMAIPSKDPSAASAALSQHFAEMTMPDASGLWLASSQIAQEWASKRYK